MILAISIFLSLLYSVLLIILAVGFFRTIKRSKAKPSEMDLGVSVVIAFRNEFKNLPTLVQALNNQTMTKEKWEVIFIDDNSNDGSAEFLNSIGINFHFKIIKLEGLAGKKQALIQGIQNAKFNLVAITDADCIPSSTWVQSALESTGNCVLIQSPVIVDFENSVVGMFEALDYASLMAVSAGSFGVGMPVIAASANLAFRKDLVEVSDKSIRVEVFSGDDMFLLHSAKQDFRHRLMFNFSTAGFVKTKFDGGFGGMINRRKRWASKASAYTDTDTIVVASAVLLFNLWIVGLAALSIFGYSNVWLLLIVWCVKVFSDLFLLFPYLIKTNQLKLMLVFLPLQLIYPFYISYSAVAGLFGGQHWKGRQIN